MARDKTLVLVFPPLTMPTSPPLGASMLKGFIEREMPDWRVRVIDLNLWTYERLFGLLAAGRIGLSAEIYPEGPAALSGLLGATLDFRGRASPENFYLRPDRYEFEADLFLRHTTYGNRTLEGMCEEHERRISQRPDAPLPALLQEMVDVILAERPDCIGFSMIFSEQLKIGATLGKHLRTRLGKKVLFGGSCFTDTAEHFLKWCPEAADVVVAGEGEDALKRLLTTLDDPSTVPGAVYIRDGVIHKNEGEFREDLDSLGQPDFGDLKLRDYFSPEPVIPLLLSRGCYWRRCTFCVHYRSAGLSYRMHSVEFVIEMLKNLVAKGVRHFAFIDEMIAPKHFEWLAAAIKEAKLDIAYYALSKPVRYFTPRILRMMAESGCKYMLWGLESGNQRVLNLMDKGTVVADVAEVLRNAQAAGIRNHVFMICGFPTETVEEFEETIRFLDENKDSVWAVHRGTFSLERQSPIFDAPQRFGITRVWLKRDDASGGRWGYETASGMSAEQAKDVFISVLPFLRVFNPFAKMLANFRDHALLIYDKVGHLLQPGTRRFPTIEYRPRPARPPGPVPLTVLAQQPQGPADDGGHSECCTKRPVAAAKREPAVAGAAGKDAS